MFEEGTYGAPEVSDVSLGNRELPFLSNLDSKPRFIKQHKLKICKTKLDLFRFWQNMFPNLDLALLMATINVLTSLPGSWCIRILRVIDIELRKFTFAFSPVDGIQAPRPVCLPPSRYPAHCG